MLTRRSFLESLAALLGAAAAKPLDTLVSVTSPSANPPAFWVVFDQDDPCALADFSYTASTSYSLSVRGVLDLWLVKPPRMDRVYELMRSTHYLFLGDREGTLIQMRGACSATEILSDGPLHMTWTLFRPVYTT